MYKNASDIFIHLEYKDNTSRADIPAFVSKTLGVRSNPPNTQQLPYCTLSQCREYYRENTDTHTYDEFITASGSNIIYYTNRKVIKKVLNGYRKQKK